MENQKRAHNCHILMIGDGATIVLERPNEIHYSYNFVSFNKAKQLLKEGEPVKPDFDDFLQWILVYSEL